MEVAARNTRMLSKTSKSYHSWGFVAYNWMDPVIVPKCLSTQLRTCLLNDHKSTESGLQFAKYIMQNSKVLNTMTIKTIKSSSSRNRKAKYQMLSKLASLPRASATCKFMFDWWQLGHVVAIVLICLLFIYVIWVFY